MPEARSRSNLRLRNVLNKLYYGTESRTFRNKAAGILSIVGSTLQGSLLTLGRREEQVSGF